MVLPVGRCALQIPHHGGVLLFLGLRLYEFTCPGHKSLDMGLAA